MTTSLDLRALLADVFECQLEDVDAEAKIDETPGWDSLNHITLMMRLGDAGFTVPMARIADLTSYAAIASFVQEAGGDVAGS